MQRGAWAIGALVLFSACADDHFDVKRWGAGDKTLWESVESNPQLTDFAALLIPRRDTPSLPKEQIFRNCSLSACCP